jgi:hopanoid biosynthesis associated protein HpnK
MATAPMSASTEETAAAAAAPRVIFTADDFGRCSDVNRAVLLACRAGVLTSASLIVTGAAAEEAVELARQLPSLAVGLHVVVSDATPVLPPGRVPHLVDCTGRLPRDPLVTGLRLAASRAARAELRAELRAQFERFASTGLPLAHVDGHMHLHVHPAVLPPVVTLASEFGARGIRLPREPLGPALRPPGPARLARTARTAALLLMSRRAEGLVRRAGLGTATNSRASSSRSRSRRATSTRS